jgi:precorrin-3B synthase
MNAPLRRGACPGLSVPMATGDGLLARLTPSGSTIGLDAFGGLCRAARTHGNGILEITSRGSIQIRGLSAASAPLFADDVAALGIGGSDGIPVLTDPLSGLAPDATFDAGALAAALRASLASASIASRLAAKISVVVDGGGALHLDDVAGDIRLRAVDGSDGPWLHVALGGDASTSVPIGAVAPESAVMCVLRLLEVLAAKAPDGRMRDVARGEGLSVLDAAVADIIVDRPAPGVRPAAEPIGRHPLRTGDVAIGVGLPFGHSESDVLLRLVEAARRARAAGLRTAPGRALLVLGLAAGAADAFAAEADALGFIVVGSDPRRRVVACAGAPICASGQIPARAMAPAVVRAAGALSPGDVIHVSGCYKGCAHPAPASVAIFGRDGGCDVVLDGARTCSVTVEDLPHELSARLRARAGDSKEAIMTERHDYLRDGTAIYRESFAIIRAETDLSRFSEDEADIVVRMIHACGNTDAAQYIAFGGGFATAARAAIANGAPILCDSEMVAHGITRARLPAANDVLCTLRDPRVPALAESLSTTRSAAAVELWADRMAGAVVAIGNAPTALFHLLDWLRRGGPQPAAIIGVPVGFVGAAESKAALAADPCGVPYMIVRGRMGGSAMTAAAVNALARAGL